MVFGNLGLDKVEVWDNKVTIPDGTYPGYVSDAKLVTKKDGNEALVLTYKVADDNSSHDGETINEWRTFPRRTEDGGFVSETDERNAQFLKARLIHLGFEADQIDKVDLDDISGIPVTFTVKTKNNYKNVSYVEVRNTVEHLIGPDQAEGLRNLI
jgi:hypothetical protein